MIAVDQAPAVQHECCNALVAVWLHMMAIFHATGKPDVVLRLTPCEAWSSDGVRVELQDLQELRETA